MLYLKKRTGLLKSFLIYMKFNLTNLLKAFQIKTNKIKSKYGIRPWPVYER